MAKDLPEAVLIDYLIWFRQNADFGPAHSDVEHWLHARFEEETQTRVPSGWSDEESK